VPAGARRSAFEGTSALVTKTLLGVNVAIYVITAAQGSGINSPGGSLFTKWLLFGPAVANGDWWRLITSAFLHANLIHIAFNMYFLWFVGSAVETALGRGRFLAVYLISGLAGSAGALVFNPASPTVGASGALFGILGAAVVLERQRDYVLGGSALGLVVINLILSFSISNISVGGHIGGLIGGILCALVLSRFGRGHAAYSPVGLWGIAGVLAVGLLSIAVAYLKVRGYAQ
jgi:membrane associated rhomboid family serine protease